ncbi:hypothetical protein JCM17380_26340 [Desulfosporosinus burensis]
MIKNEDVSCTECIYCGSTENVFSFCKVQHTTEGEKNKSVTVHARFVLIISKKT